MNPNQIELGDLRAGSFTKSNGGETMSLLKKIMDYGSSNAATFVPPAEPDSGIQEQKHGLKNKKMLAAIHTVIIEHSGNGLLADKVCNFLAWKPDAPSDHVEHVRRKARQLIAALESFGWVVLADDKHATQRKALEQVIEQIFRELLSSHRSNSPATSVEAKPDSVPKETDVDIANLIKGAVFASLAPYYPELGANCGADLVQSIDQISKVIYKAKLLGALRSGSEVSGVAAHLSNLAYWRGEYEARLRCMADALEESEIWLLHVTATESGDTYIKADSTLRKVRSALQYKPSPAPSAPSSTEQKGT